VNNNAARQKERLIMTPAEAKDLHCEVCGASLMMPKKGNLCCSGICWKNPDFDDVRQSTKEMEESVQESYPDN